MSKKNPTHLDEMLEWQEHQYDPLYYTEGKLPPELLARGKPSWAAIWWFFQAFLVFISYFAITFRVFFFGDELPSVSGSYRISTFWTVFFITVIFLLLFLLSIRLGIRYMQKHKEKKSNFYHTKQRRRRSRK